MKIIYKLIFTVIGSLLFTSCNDDYLQETPMSFLAPENTFVNTKVLKQHLPVYTFRSNKNGDGAVEMA